jgi:hypothetical protein
MAVDQAQHRALRAPALLDVLRASARLGALLPLALLGALLPLALLGCPAEPSPFADPDDDGIGGDDDAAGDDDLGDDDAAAECPAGDATSHGHDLDAWVIVDFGLAGVGPWGDEDCLQAVIAADRAPNMSPGGRCWINPGQMVDYSNSLAGGGIGDLEFNFQVFGLGQPRSATPSTDSFVEVRVSRDGDWLHWIGSAWGGLCTIDGAEDGRTGRISCRDLVGRYGPDPDAGDPFGTFDLTATWACPEVSPD